MFRKLIYLVSFVVVLSLVGDVQAAKVDWTDAGPDHLWSTAPNWSTSTLPTSDDSVRIDMLPGPTVANEGAVAGQIRIGRGGDSALTVDGGTLTTTTAFQVAHGDDTKSTLNMKSGTITVGGDFNLGSYSSGTLNMTGGTIIGKSWFYIATKSTTTGHVDLHGGIITTKNFGMRRDAGSVGTMDVGTGTLIINGDAVSTVQGYIDNGWITAYDSQGGGTLSLEYDETEDKTTLTAVHNFNPTPADRGTVGPGAVELSWTLPDPCVPGQPVLVDVYFTDDRSKLEQFTDPAAIQVVSKQNVTSVVVQTQPKTRYYWAIDTYIGSADDPILGPIFSFLADNTPPSVNAGPNISTFLQDGTRTGPLSGIVMDDGAIQPYTVTWSVVEQPSDDDSALPGAVIADPTAEQTTVTVSAEGTYVLQLEADDGEYTSSDTMTINVHPDDWTE